MDYAAYVKAVKKLDNVGGGVRNPFRHGKYRVNVTRCVSRQTRSGADQVILEGTIVDVLDAGPRSCQLGELCSLAETICKVPEFLVKRMVAISAAVLRMAPSDLRGPDPEEDPEGAKEASANLGTIFADIFPADGGESESLAVGHTVIVTVRPNPKKPEYDNIYIDADFV